MPGLVSSPGGGGDLPAIVLGAVAFGDDQQLNFGTASNTGIEWDTAQAVDSWMFGVDVVGRSLHICDIGDMSFNFQNLAQTNPTLYLHAATADIIDYIAFAHTGGLGAIFTGSGTVNFYVSGAPGTGTLHSQISGTIGQATYFNINSDDVDFQVNSDNIVQMFFIDASSNTVGFGGAGADGIMVRITEPIRTTGTPSALVITGAAHTGITAATEATGINFNLSASKTWGANAGPLSQQREVRFQGPTYVGDAGGALTITNATTIAIDAAPTAGLNMTLTNSLGLQAADDVGIGFGVGAAGDIVARFLWETRDADANALILALPTGGGGTDVPVFAVGDASIIDFGAAGTGLGFFNGLTNPLIAAVAADQLSFIGIESLSTGVSYIRSNSATLRTITAAGTQSNIIAFTAAGGATVWNDQNLDIDFRINSDTITSFFNLDANGEFAGIGGTGAAGQTFTVTDFSRAAGTPTAFVVTGAIHTGGVPVTAVFTGGAHTGIAAAAEAIGINFNQSATKTWATGAGPLAQQREFVFQAPTYAGGVAALTITEANSVYISGAPIQGANMTLTETLALHVDAGRVRFNDLKMDGAVITAFTAANDTVGTTTRIRTQGGGTSTGVGRVGGGLTITVGAGSAAAGASGLAGGDAGAFTFTGGTAGAGDVAGIDGAASAVAFSVIDGFTITQTAKNEGSAGSFSYIAGAHLDQANSIGGEMSFDFSATKNFLGGGGAIAQANGLALRARTYTADAAQAITAAATLYIDAAPTAGANITLSTSTFYALFVDSGASRFDGAVIKSQGTDIASAGTITIPTNGNTFELTGVTGVTLITSTGYQEGHEITLIANENVSISHATATAGANITILLAGAVTYSMTANDTLRLVLSSTTAGGQAWREIGRAVI